MWLRQEMGAESQKDLVVPDKISFHSEGKALISVLHQGGRHQWPWSQV